ncbi:pentatricopeptide repeat-containing protein At4g21065 isoform X1 [Musa acuminata AAA Group]|uniref:pentatricopeptide repeat-containing protein At4g21065 isoform X1 n=1 Tax=Musa acuminata AAA Group TaxID=214697 RepID=UPI0031D735E0
MLWSSRHLSSLFRRSSSLLHLLQLHSLILKAALDHRPSVASKLISSLWPFSLAHARSVLSNLASPPPLFAWNSLIRAYADSDSPQEAIHLFSALRRAGNGRPDNLSYPFVLRACGRASVLRVGEMVHGVVLKAGFFLDLYVGNTLLHMYACCGVSKCAREVFDEMGVRDVVTWSSMIQGYLACSHPVEALMVFLEMRSANVKPNSVTLISLLSASSYLASPCTGRAIHSYIVVNNIKLDVALGAALVSMYAKCGLLEEAFQVFKSLQEQDLQSWTIMIAGFVDHGQWEKAIDLFSQMEASGVRPDSTIFSVILCACSHLGMVDVGQTMFSRMVNEFHIKPTIEHYGCMVDLFGRAGLLETAYEFIKNMSITPNNVILRSFLGACRKSGKSFDIGDDLLKLLLEEEPDLGSNYVIAANMSALSGKWNDVAELRSNISKKGLKKVPACSWVEGNAEVPEWELLETSG